MSSLPVVENLYLFEQASFGIFLHAVVFVVNQSSFQCIKEYFRYRIVQCIPPCGSYCNTVHSLSVAAGSRMKHRCYLGQNARLLNLPYLFCRSPSSVHSVQAGHYSAHPWPIKVPVVNTVQPRQRDRASLGGLE